MLESFSASGSFVHSPCGPRKSGIPDSVEIPAPVRITMRLASSIHARTEAIRGSGELIHEPDLARAAAPIAMRLPGDGLFSATPLPFLLTTQFEPLDLSRRGLRQLGEELDPARILVGSELVLDVLPERRLQRVGPRVALLENDVGLGLDELVLVFGADYRRFQHRFVRDESGFDFSGRDVDTRDLQHVVRAPAVYVVAVLVQA